MLTLRREEAPPAFAGEAARPHEGGLLLFFAGGLHGDERRPAGSDRTTDETGTG